MADAGLTWEDLRVIPKEEVAKHNTLTLKNMRLEIKHFHLV
jgi:hypothetical protein